MKTKSYPLQLAALAIIALACGSVAAGERWESLFDGKTLDGWVQRGGKALYAVEDGTIVGTTAPQTPNSFLCTAKNYGDFILELEFQVDPELNSGIQIRSNSLADYKKGRVHGYQVEIDPSPRAYSAGIYDESRRGWLYPLDKNPEARQAFKQNGWNHYRIEAIGESIKTWINGVAAADLRDSMTPTGFIGLQVHSSGSADRLRVRWRDIRLQNLDRAPGVLAALIVDGHNNHNWKATTPILREILEDTGLFKVDVATFPKDAKTLEPDFAKYDVIVSNYNGPDWSAESSKAFVEYMRSGGGLVTYHAADNSFPRWTEFNEMIGVGGWGGRNEESGPMVRYRDGEVVLDDSPGRGGTHGPQHDFQVVIRDPHHEITRGLPEVWMHAKDELYAKLRGPAKNLTVLATAYAPRTKGGTDEHEPMLMALRFGKGRVFHTTLGHSPHATRCAGFAFTFQRGVEWAARGKVTLTDIPENFPTADDVRFWTPAPDYADIATYDFGQSRKNLAAVEAAIRGASPTKLRQVERQLLKVLENDEATYAARQFVMRVLRRIGSAQSVPVLAQYLDDEKLAHMARFALQRLPDPAVDEVFRKAVDRLEGKLLVGVIGSIGDRRDRGALEKITPHLSSTGEALAEATIKAVGRIGGTRAVEALGQATVPANLETLKIDSILLCADGLTAEGNGTASAAIYIWVARESTSRPLSIAAYHGLARAQPTKAVPVITKLLESSDAEWRGVAMKIIGEMPGEKATLALAAELDSLKPAGQAALIEALARRDDNVAARAVSQAARSDDTQVRLAALRALAIVGDASTVVFLAEVAARGGETGEVAMASLQQLGGDDVGAAIVRAIASHQTGAVRSKAIEAAQARGESRSVPALLEVARADSDASARKASYRALANLADEKALPDLVEILVDKEKADERQDIEKTLISVAGRIENRDEGASYVLKALDRADGETKANLLGVLPKLANDRALVALREYVKDDDRKVREKAVRALGDWPDTRPMADLKTIAQSSNGSIRDAAVMSYIRLASRPANRPARASTALIADALKLATRTGEKQAALRALTSFACAESMELAESYKDDPDLRGVAEESAKAIRTVLLNKALSATASHGGGEAKNAFDGDPGSRWSTGRPMQPGDWFQIDLGRESVVTGILLDTRRSEKDFPRGYEVLVSFDGKSWGDPVLKGNARQPLVHLEFNEPVHARYIKIVQTGSSRRWHWSIHELKVEFQ